MKYAYEDLSPSQFEALVVAICQIVLGAGAQGFAAGPDGGRDAKFIGTAQMIPSEREPWRGTVIVQAKHTNGYNKTFSDADFYSEDNEDTVLGKELPRVKRLRDDGELDHYLLFSNRRLTGNGESKLRGVIATTCGVPLASLAILGVEQLELWLKRFPEAARIANVDPIDSPLIVSPDELAEVVEHLALRLGDDTGGGAPPGDRVTYARKNELNKMSAEYAREMRKRFLKETGPIQRFLAAPENEAVLARYALAVEEFQLKVIARRRDFDAFDDVLIYLIDLVLARDPILRANARLSRALIFYMYWNCDLGKSDDVETE